MSDVYLVMIPCATENEARAAAKILFGKGVNLPAIGVFNLEEQMEILSDEPLSVKFIGYYSDKE